MLPFRYGAGRAPHCAYAQAFTADSFRTEAYDAHTHVRCPDGIDAAFMRLNVQAQPPAMSAACGRSVGAPCRASSEKAKSKLTPIPALKFPARLEIRRFDSPHLKIPPP